MASSRQKVLLIDDDVDIRDWIQRLVGPLQADLVTAYDGASGIAAARANHLDLILLDMNLPDMQGIDVCRILRADADLADVPIIFLTGAEDAEAKVNAFACGASDYVTKPFDPRELRARVRNALRTESLRTQLERQASTDTLTGLPNRGAFRRAIERQIARASAELGYGFCLMFVDLDRFKIINDSLGHEAGDRLLVHVTQCLNKLARDLEAAGIEAIVARMGGDEFTLVLSGVVDDDVANAVASSILDALATPALLGTATIRAFGSVGIRVARGDESSTLNVSDLLRDADVAMYQAKTSGRGRYAIFDQAMHQQLVDRVKMEHDLRDAVARGELELYYQPLVDLQSGEVAAFEALVRWRHPQLGMVSPATFVALAEESELIVDLGAWVLRTAIQFAATLVRRQPPDEVGVWRAAPRRTPHVCINISKRQLAVPQFAQFVTDLIAQANLSPDQVELEITESAIMYDPFVVGPVLAALRTGGIRLAIDDFGTGFSSLSMLPQFPVNVLKIDQSFISKLGISRGETAIVNAVVSLATHLGMTVVGEGIETVDQLNQLQSIGCGLGQGYLFGKPVPAALALLLPTSVVVPGLAAEAA